MTHSEEHELIRSRREKLSKAREQGYRFPNDIRPSHLSGDLHERFRDASAESLEAEHFNVLLAGRMMLQRHMGKASFFHLQDRKGRLQVYVRQDAVGADLYEAFKDWDLGDIVSVEGYLFRTKTGELSVHAVSLSWICPCLRPLPDKFHGVNDIALRYRERYVDLMVHQEVREVFYKRAQVVDHIRSFLKARDFCEVETPMMQTLAGGAAARPFATHHHALDMPLFLRIAPELFLKRLVVGGIERVFEINRNFRNEGISTQHNPEFTMLEFYQAYADYRDLMDLTETLLRELALLVVGSLQVPYQGKVYDLEQPFARYSMVEAIVAYGQGITAADLEQLDKARVLSERLGLQLLGHEGLGQIQLKIFEAVAEPHLEGPVFITQYPAEVSPLARRNDENPLVTDRFEFFIAGREIANGFSELNDAEDQAERFREQCRARDAGDDEAMLYDEDYVKALEYGLPPTAGEGIGIDRLVMFLADQPSIRDVLLFPLMRPVKQEA